MVDKCVTIQEFCEKVEDLEEGEDTWMCVEFNNKKIVLHAVVKVWNEIEISLNKTGCLEYVVTSYNNSNRRTSHLYQLLYDVNGPKESCSGFTKTQFGTFIMELVDKLNFHFFVENCSLEDDAQIQEGVHLSMLYYLKYNMSWYNSKGYISNDHKQISKDVKFLLKKPIRYWLGYISHGRKWLKTKESKQDFPSVISLKEILSTSIQDLFNLNRKVRNVLSTSIVDIFQNTGESFQEILTTAINENDIKTLKFLSIIWTSVFLRHTDKDNSLRIFTKTY